jgi:palmitoyltransferase ZDHHC13/17
MQHTDTLQDIEVLPDNPNLTDQDCAILKDPFCTPFLRDPMTIITNAWATLQLTWTFMLLFVHLTQVARAITTYETMRGQGQVGPLLTAVTTGSATAEGASINSNGAGPDPVHPHAHAKKKEGCLTQWYKILGLDTFFTIAFQGYKGAKERDSPAARTKTGNPFSRGVFRNCQDFWMDGPVFGRKDSGTALLGGELIDYRDMYEVPRGGMRYRNGGRYEAVSTVEEG